MSSSCQRSSSTALGGGFLGGIFSVPPKFADVVTTFNGVATGLCEEYKEPFDAGGFEGALKLNFLCDIVLFKIFDRPTCVRLRHLFTFLRVGGWTSEVVFATSLLLSVPQNKSGASLNIVNVDMNFVSLAKNSHRKHGEKHGTGTEISNKTRKFTENISDRWLRTTTEKNIASCFVLIFYYIYRDFIHWPIRRREKIWMNGGNFQTYEVVGNGPSQWSQYTSQLTVAQFVVMQEKKRKKRKKKKGENFCFVFFLVKYLWSCVCFIVSTKADQSISISVSRITPAI